MLIFFDLEVNKNSNQIESIGLVTETNKKMETKSEATMSSFIRKNRGSYFIGHNIINHDLKYFKTAKIKARLRSENIIDTLLLSTLIFSNKPYHNLVKDDKLNSGTLNNPVNDATNSRILFFDIVEAFKNLNKNLQDIYYLLLKDTRGFQGFFNYLNYKTNRFELHEMIRNYFKDDICDNAKLNIYINSYKIELAYVLSLIQTTKATSLLPPWVLKNYSTTEEILTELRNKSCERCSYCENNLNSEKALKQYFNYPSFRKFSGVDLQKQSVEAALRGESLIAVFPTGGGKSLAFQLPALMDGRNTRGLTVVISPLQSLMKDQVDSLADKNITNAVAISGLLDPIERKKAIERTMSGDVNILYLAPESLRNRTIERILLTRKITRIVIDEAHCFSTWGHDFRVDYLYIAQFIKNIQEIKNLKEPIPVSCFTATAKVDVIEDIKDYFYERLNLNLKEFTTSSERDNLFYLIKKVDDEQDRYSQLRNLLIEKDVPTIIYCSRVLTVTTLHERLNNDQLKAVHFYGKLDKDIKIMEQEKFMTGEVNIMVATSAFGMGIDKDNVERVIHYEISDSLENYVQESGRAGRSQEISANCYIFYNEDDLNKHFELLNRTKLNQSEINQLWSGIKRSTRDRNVISKSALELATNAGWDEGTFDLETRVRTAVSTLEEVGYIKRGQNTYRVFADSLLSKSIIEAQKKMKEANIFSEEEIQLANRVIQSLISSKYKSLNPGEVSEMRVDYLADILGVRKEEIIVIINKFREIGILADDKDLYAHIKYNSTTIVPNRVINQFKNVSAHLINKFKKDKKTHLNLKQFKSELEAEDIKVNIRTLKAIINYFSYTKYFKLKKLGIDDLEIEIKENETSLQKTLENRVSLAFNIIEIFYNMAKNEPLVKKDNLLPFSIMDMRKRINNKADLFNIKYTTDEIEEAIYLLTKIDALKIEGGFLVIYSPINIEKLETNVHKGYTQEDYKKLNNFYQVKKEQIHIVGEYANKMIESESEANEFVNDYFTIEYNEFLNKYFKGKRKKELAQNMTPKRYQELFGTLTDQQRAVIDDDKNARIGVSAGPGSGKTKLLVHKLAAILYTEDTKTEELLMLTFSRAAAIEFKERLFDLIGSPAYYVNITTFHSFAFDITESLGNSEKFDEVIKEATKAIKDVSADTFKITKSVLVIDEAQDMTKEEFELVEALINFNDGIRVIAVGDDDQNIFEWRGSSSEYLKQIADEGAFYELTINFRSKNNIVKFANIIRRRINKKQKISTLKSHTLEDGTIETITYKTDNFVVPFVDRVVSDNLKGKTCIITRTNEDAVIINGLLNKKGLKTSLIQDNDDFRLYDVLEFRTFYNSIKKETEFRIDKIMLTNAFDELKKKHKQSINYSFTEKTLKKLLKNYKELFLSDLNDLLFETRYSDIFDEKSYVVSTFHKAKGKQFDNVYVLYNDDKITNDEMRRTFYVGVTRAKSFLSIHSRMDFKNIELNNFKKIYNNNEYEETDYLELNMYHRDLHLGISKRYIANIENINCGCSMTINKNHYLFIDNKLIGKLSKLGTERYINNIEKGYKLKKITLNKLVYWYDAEEREEYLLAFPKIVFEKGNAD